MNHDVGYGLLRVSEAQTWEPRFLLNIPLAAVLMLFFEWYVGLQTYILKKLLFIKQNLA